MSNPLTTPIDAIVFDCDGTLSKLEGINELAKTNGVEEAVSKLTERAMSEGLFGEKIYEQRLNLTKPTKKQLEQLGHDYIEQLTDDILPVIELFQSLNKTLFILTAGLTPAIEPLAEYLNIPKENIYAVDIYFDEQGNYQDFDRTSPLITTEGKCQIVKELMSTYPRIAHVGDGMNDFSSHKIVTRFVGFGGNYHRKSMEDCCDYYIKTTSIKPLISLCLTEEETPAF